MSVRVALNVPRAIAAEPRIIYSSRVNGNAARVNVDRARPVGQHIRRDGALGEWLAAENPFFYRRF